MRINGTVTLMLLLGFSSVVSANDFPTAERVEYVLNCLQKMGRSSMHDLQTCSCRIDSIASNMSFETYSYAVTYNRNKRMVGEQGGVFRDNEAGKSFAKELAAAEEAAGGQCKEVVHINAPTDLTENEKYNKIEEIK